MRLFTDWRGQAALCVFLAAAAVYMLVYLLDGGPGYLVLLIVSMTVSSVSYGWGAVQAHREVVERRVGEKPQP